MTKTERIEKLERELDALKKIVSADKIVLTDSQNENVTLEISFKSGLYNISKKTTVTTTNVTVQNLENFNTNQL